MFTCLEPHPGPSTSGGELVLNMPATIEEIQGVVAGLSEVVKGLDGAIQAVHTAEKQPGHTLLRLEILLFPLQA